MNTSPLCILYTLMPQIIFLYTLTLVHTWYEESHPWVDKVGEANSVSFLNCTPILAPK